MKLDIYGQPAEITLLAGPFEVTIQNGGTVAHGLVTGHIYKGTEKVTLKVILPVGTPVLGYGMSYEGNRHQDDVVVREVAGGTQVFSKVIPIGWGGGTPQLPTNGGQSLRLLSVDVNGRLHDLVVSLVRQGDKLFVTVQETYREQLYKAGDLVVSPPMEKTRMSTLERVRKLLEGHDEFIATLPAASTYQKPDLKKQSLTLREGEGLVLWFADGMNSGSVLCRDGRQHKVHYTEILTIRHGRKFLRTGEKVLFRGKKPIPGRSQFPDQLTDVQVEGQFPQLLPLRFNPEPDDFTVTG